MENSVVMTPWRRDVTQSNSWDYITGCQRKGFRWPQWYVKLLFCPHHWSSENRFWVHPVGNICATCASYFNFLLLHTAFVQYKARAVIKSELLTVFWWSLLSCHLARSDLLMKSLMNSWNMLCGTLQEQNATQCYSVTSLTVRLHVNSL